jgi:hypothetical protein
MNTHFNLLDLPNTPSMRGELLSAIKNLAQERFIQLEVGTEADFETLWYEAFCCETPTREKRVASDFRDSRL